MGGRAERRKPPGEWPHPYPAPYGARLARSVRILTRPLTGLGSPGTPRRAARLLDYFTSSETTRRGYTISPNTFRIGSPSDTRYGLPVKSWISRV